MSESMLSSACKVQTANIEQIFINNNEIERILNRYQNMCTKMDQEFASLTEVPEYTQGVKQKSSL